MREPLDEIDMRILREVQRDGQVTSHELAARVGVSKTPAWRRRQRLIDKGYITNTVALLDPASLGFKVRAQIRMKLTDEEQRDALEAFLQEDGRIVEAHRVTGDVDYTVGIVARNNADVLRFQKKLQTRVVAIRIIETAVTLSIIKKTTELPL